MVGKASPIGFVSPPMVSQSRKSFYLFANGIVTSPMFLSLRQWFHVFDHGLCLSANGRTIAPMFLSLRQQFRVFDHGLCFFAKVRASPTMVFVSSTMSFCLRVLSSRLRSSFSTPNKNNEHFGGGKFPFSGRAVAGICRENEPGRSDLRSPSVSLSAHCADSNKRRDAVPPVLFRRANICGIKALFSRKRARLSVTGYFFRKILKQTIRQGRLQAGPMCRAQAPPYQPGAQQTTAGNNTAKFSGGEPGYRVPMGVFHPLSGWT